MMDSVMARAGDSSATEKPGFFGLYRGDRDERG